MILSPLSLLCWQLKKKLKSINKKWQADQFKALQRKQLFDSTRHLRDSHRMTLQERQEEEQDRRYRLKQAEVMAMIMESRREYEKRRRRKLRVEEEKYEKVKREEEMSRRDQAMQREKREAEHLLEEKRRQEMELKEKKSQRMRERRELKYRDQKRKEELEKLFKTVPPEIKETKSSVDRVKAVSEHLVLSPPSPLMLCCSAVRSKKRRKFNWKKKLRGRNISKR
jgi:hypothetical protein